MGQQEIIEYLEKEMRWLSRGEIAEALKWDGAKTSHHIKKLLKANFIISKEISRDKAKKKYNCPRRMMIYFINEEIE